METRFSTILLYFLSIGIIFNFACKGEQQNTYIDLSFPGLPDSLNDNSEKIKFLRWENSPILFHQGDKSESFSWISTCGTRQLIKIFPNRGYRDSMGITHVSKITGANHFLLDMDLVSHYVHPFTINFFNRLRNDDFVMKYTPTDSDSTIGFMEFIRKSDVSPSDKLGFNLAFFRQWKLSELVIKDALSGHKIKLKICDFNPVCFCPEVNPGSTNPFNLEVPIWHSNGSPGWVKLNRLNIVGKFDGGNVVLIWEYKNNIWFQEMHGSLYQILTQAFKIKEIAGSEVSIAISDAGPMSATFKSDSSNTLKFNEINKLAPEPYVGAGYGCFPSQIGVYRYDDGKGQAIDFIQSY